MMPTSEQGPTGMTCRSGLTCSGNSRRNGELDAPGPQLALLMRGAGIEGFVWRVVGDKQPDQSEDSRDQQEEHERRDD